MKPNSKAKSILAFIIATVCLAIFPAAALATDINVTADSTSVTQGDTVTLTVTVSGSGIAVADGVFTYDPSLLSYISSNGGASDGYINLVSAQEGGSSSLTVIIKFAAIGEGEAVIDVVIENALDYDGGDLGDAQAGVSITVASSGEDGGEDGGTADPLDLSLTGVAAQNVLGTEEPMYIWRSLRNVSLPSGFTDRQVTYADEYVGGAAIPDNEDLILLYLSEADGANAGYYIYDEEKGELFPYLIMTSVSAKYTFIWPGEDIEAPEGYEETMIELSGNLVPAWLPPGSDGTVYLVYARTSSGEVGFYLYNVEDSSLQRFMAFGETETESEPTVQTTPEPAQTPEPPKEEEQQTELIVSPALIPLIISAGILFAIAAIVFAVLYFVGRARQAKQRKKVIKIKDADIK